ncbi:MAG TPA: deoxyribose-phosphate aldolase [Chitinophagaceae bacterium]|nr:deoxyribose-phosphate aldolase [Chitinophagaceae bacterium]
MEIASYIDHTILKPTTTIADVEKVCSEAIEYHFAAVCIPPYFVKKAFNLVENTAVKLATVIGFPFGYNPYAAKLTEVKKAIKDKANEIDIVMNLAAFKDKNFTYLTKEIGAITTIARMNNVTTKLIIETAYLNEDELKECCSLFGDSGINFMKTSTGYADKGATIEAVSILRKHLPGEVKIKASGGIKTLSFARSLIEAGAERLGCSSSVALINEERVSGGY